MAREIIERYTDDIDPTTEATHVGVSFSLEGESFTTDLNDSNYEDLKAALDRFAAHATKVSGSGRGRPRSSNASPVSGASAKEKKSELAAIRAWCELHKIQISQRGRISESVLHAYKENDPSLVGG